MQHWVCIQQDASTTECNSVATSTEVSYLGTLNFGVAIIITFIFLGFLGYIFNRISSKKPWKPHIPLK